MDQDKLRNVFQRVATAAGHATRLELVRSETANAWTDGDVVYITDSLVASMAEREVAAVLAHEFGHVVERHLATTSDKLRRLHKRLTSSFSNNTLESAIAAGVVAAGLIAATGRRSRTLERRADRYGERCSQIAGYAPGAMAEALERLPVSDTSFTHPSTTERQLALSRGSHTIRVRITRRK